MELTQHERITLEIFTTDTGAFETVKKVADAYIRRQKDVFISSLGVKKDLSNEEIGAKIRAFDEAMFLIEGVFREVSTFKKVKKDEEVKNPGR